MSTTTHGPADIGASDFEADAHAAKYRAELESHPAACRRLFALLNDPANEQRLVDAELHGMPALAGVVRFIEADPAIELILATGSDGFRFRQTVGVAVKLKMAKLGWNASGRKGTVRGARHFTKAERYIASGQPEPTHDYRTKALAALDSLATIGDDEERHKTGQALMQALSSSRQAEGRPF